MRLLIAVTMLLLSCNKLLDTDDVTVNPPAREVYANDSSANQVVLGIYYRLLTDGLAAGEYSMTFYLGLYADEYILNRNNPVEQSFYKNSLQPVDNPFWEKLYQYIYTANAAIEGISGSNSLSAGVKQQLLGELRFIKAFCYFYLVNLFGDVPWLTSADFSINRRVPRTPGEEVYGQLIADLQLAQQLLPEQYVGADAISPTTLRMRPSRWVATALLARVFLYRGKWELAAAEASKVIAQQEVFQLETLTRTFQANSREAIWMLDRNSPPEDNRDAVLFTQQDHPVSLAPSLKDDFDKDDKRLQHWIGKDVVYYPFKYKTGGTTPYTLVLRLAELYLVRAEARAQLGLTDGAKADLNMVRQRAGLKDITANGKPAILKAIMQEYRRELFAEWGHRWLNIKRNETTYNQMPAIASRKGGKWSSHKLLFPLPKSELSRNPLLKQNPGYETP